MTTTAPDLYALIGSRICHDLISPLGAIGNGVELLSMSGVAGAPEMALIAESVDSANARIRFYRIAFGATGRGATLGRGEVTRILTDMFRGGRTEVAWSVDGDQRREEVKLAFLLILCAEATMPRGGRMTVARTEEKWSLTFEAERLKVDPSLWSVTTGETPPEGLAAADVHFALAPYAAEAAGRRIDVTGSERAMAISF